MSSQLETSKSVRKREKEVEHSILIIERPLLSHSFSSQNSQADTVERAHPYLAYNHITFRKSFTVSYCNPINNVSTVPRCGDGRREWRVEVGQNGLISAIIDQSSIVVHSRGYGSGRRRRYGRLTGHRLRGRDGRGRGRRGIGGTSGQRSWTERRRGDYCKLKAILEDARWHRSVAKLR